MVKITITKNQPLPVDKLDEVADSLCVGQKINDGGDERVVLFLKMAGGWSLDETLTKKVKAVIRKELSARHVPAIILEIADIPVKDSDVTIRQSHYCL